MKYDEFFVRDRLRNCGRFVFPPGSQIFRRNDRERHYPPIGAPVGWSDVDNDGYLVAGTVIDSGSDSWSSWATCLVRIPVLDQSAESTDETSGSPKNFDHESVSFEEHTRILLSVARKVLLDGVDKHREAFSRAVDDVTEWYEHIDDPRANGWVGSDGLP